MSNYFLKCRMVDVVYNSLLQVCGGEDKEADNESRKELHLIAASSISFPNKINESTEGKPHDIEVKAALTLFHRRKRKNSERVGFQAISDLGLVRNICSPPELAALLHLVIEEFCGRLGISDDVRCSPAGIICIVTRGRAQALLQAKRYPCPYCVKWCKGEKGLWWHQQQVHGVEYSAAAASAASHRPVLSIVRYGTKISLPLKSVNGISNASADEPLGLDVFEVVKSGDLIALKHAVEHDGCDPITLMDAKGASPLLWAAGGGYLELVKYLIETCHCSPNQGQKGKRSFAGRTALHWAARNGHLPVVEYLIETCKVDMEATTSDGTTAFSWACWQNHLHIMKYLAEKGCDIHKMNSFGCNAVLWFAQGEKGTLESLAWLESVGSNLTLINTSGHGILHKAAQRGRYDICAWFFDKLRNETLVAQQQRQHPLEMVGPDKDGSCPSDLAGAEGHEDLARWLATNEMKLVKKFNKGHLNAPSWLVGPPTKQHKILQNIETSEEFEWEPWSGVCRMQSMWNIR